MRWELLFADLEGQLAAAEATELSMEVAERSRHELGALSIVDRLLAARGAPVRCGTVAGDVLAGVIAEVGPDWLLIADPVTGAYEELVALGAVGWVEGLGRASAGGAKGPVWQRLNLRHALRALSRERAVIDVAVTGRRAAPAPWTASEPTTSTLRCIPPTSRADQAASEPFEPFRSLR